MLIISRHKPTLFLKKHIIIPKPNLQPGHKKIQISSKVVLREIHHIDKDVGAVREKKSR